MKIRIAGCTVAIVTLAAAGSVLANHSIARFDTTTAVTVKGVIVRFEQINPHSILFLEQKRADGEIQRWAVEGPSVFQLTRTGFAKDALKPGDEVEVCGYVPKETTVWQIASPDPRVTSLAGRLINAEVMVMPDGKQRSWGDYGVHKCFAPGYTDQHSAR